MSVLPSIMFAQDCQNTCPGVSCPEGVSPVCTDSGYWVCACTTDNAATCYESSDCGSEGYTCVDSCCVYSADCSSGACLSASDCGTDSEDWSCSDGCCVYSSDGGCAPPYNYEYLSADGCGCALADDCQSGCCDDYECDEDCGGGGCGGAYSCGNCVEDGGSCGIGCDSVSGNCQCGVCSDSYADEQCDLSPHVLLVALSGAGFPLTTAQNGAKFDFLGNGTATQMAWTAAGSSVGWLALDRNGNGQIDDGAELFSNVAPQPDSPGRAKLGFEALAAYDLPANGGNGDGVIDQRDAVFSKLLVWVDKNHNGVSEPGELLTMQQAGIQSISLGYKPSKRADAYGNRFVLRSKITFAVGKPAGAGSIYEVTLVTKNAPAQQ